jgi:hypothetical protein
VIHSHNYTLRQTFKRYFDSVYAITVIFPKHGLGVTASSGSGYLCKEFLYVARNRPGMLPYYVLYLLAKTGGTVAGHFARYMPRRMARACSLHAFHWDRIS